MYIVMILAALTAACVLALFMQHERIEVREMPNDRITICSSCGAMECECGNNRPMRISRSRVIAWRYQGTIN